MGRLALTTEEKRVCPSLGINAKPLNEFEKSLNKYIREIHSKDNKIKRLEEQLERLKQKLALTYLQVKGKQSRILPVEKRDNFGLEATTKELNRILIMLDGELKPKTAISIECGNINMHKLDNALSFLSKNGFIEEVKDCGFYYYRRKSI